MSFRSEKFALARRYLMLPHPEGEAVSIAHAFREIALGLHCLDVSSLTDIEIEDWFFRLQELMDTTGLDDAGRIGLFRVKAALLGDGDKTELSRIVDELEKWFRDSRSISNFG